MIDGTYYDMQAYSLGMLARIRSKTRIFTIRLTSVSLFLEFRRLRFRERGISLVVSSEFHLMYNVYVSVIQMGCQFLHIFRFGFGRPIHSLPSLRYVLANWQIFEE